MARTCVVRIRVSGEVTVKVRVPRGRSRIDTVLAEAPKRAQEYLRSHASELEYSVTSVKDEDEDDHLARP